MAQLHKTTASLRIFGDGLDPNEITQLLGCPPTEGFRKGEIVQAQKTGREHIKKSGGWLLEADYRQPNDLNEQIKSLLERTTDDLKIWKHLADRFRIDLFCGLFLKETNEGLDVSAKSLQLLGERSILLGLDIYAP